RCALEVCAWRFRILFYVNIGDDHLARRVHIISEQSGGVVLVLLNDFIITDGSVESLAAGGQLRNPHEHAAFVKIGPLFSETDLNRGAAAGVIAVPIRDGIARWTTTLLLATVNAAQIRRVAGKARIFAASCDE